MWTRTTPLRVVTLPVLQPTASPNERAAASVWASREVSRMTETDVTANGMLTATIIAAMAMTALRRFMVRCSGPAEWAASRWMRGLYHAHRRPPQVSVAPAGASIPEGWRSPGDFH